MLKLSFNKPYSKFGVLKYQDETSKFSIKVSKRNVGVLLDILPETKKEEK